MKNKKVYFWVAALLILVVLLSRISYKCQIILDPAMICSKARTVEIYYSQESYNFYAALGYNKKIKLHVNKVGEDMGLSGTLVNLTGDFLNIDYDYQNSGMEIIKGSKGFINTNSWDYFSIELKRLPGEKNFTRQFKILNKDEVLTEVYIDGVFDENLE